MTLAQAIWAVLIVAQLLVFAVAFFVLKGTLMSDAFKTALAALTSYWSGKVNDLQTQLDAATADKAAALAALDAEATAEVVAATPTA